MTSPTLQPRTRSIDSPATRRGSVPTTRPVPGLAVVAALLAVAVIAGVINYAISRAGLALGVSPSFPDFNPAIFLSATGVGVLAGTLGWLLVLRVSARPARTLRVVVPVVALLSFAPDLALLITGGQPGTTPLAVACLMSMHVVIIALTVPVLRRVLPPR